MKIAVHLDKDNPGFSTRWGEHLQKRGVDTKWVDCYSTNIVSDLADCDALMWHWYQFDHAAILFARQLTHALEATGKFVFPDAATSWHFDDKVGQKYLLEAIGAPLVPSHVFYAPNSALEWLNNTEYPIVFKLRGGAGSQNVRLVKNLAEGRSLVRRAFGRGFQPHDRWAHLKDRLWQVKRDTNFRSLVMLARGVARWIIPTKFERLYGREKGYVYFQKFMPNNNFDTRVIVIGGKAFAIRRFNRAGDFRASGSGIIDYDPERIDKRCLEIALNTNKKLETQCLAYDFIHDEDGSPLIVEISYGFVLSGYDQCPGYWDEHLVFYPGEFNPQAFMVDDLIEAVNKRTQAKFL